MSPPKLSNDCFALPQGVDWTPVPDALSRLRARLSPVTEVEHLPLIEAAGRVLADAPVALRSNPPQSNSAVDGYGFAFESLATAREISLLLLEGRAAAGAPLSGEIPPGHAVRILTGAILPPGVDTVVLQEDVEVAAGSVHFATGLKRGANCRKSGEDVDAGARVLAPGRRLQPQDLALCSALGIGELPVHRRLRVGVLSTGDEVVPPGAPVAPHQIHDANGPMLCAILARWGMEPVPLGIVGDTSDMVSAALDEGALSCDAILTSGGASAGDEDHVSAALRAADALHTWRIAIKPGRPLALGLWKGTPVFGLPGNPVAAFVCTLLFARPALHSLSGAGWRDPVAWRLPAAFTKRKKPGRQEYLRARCVDGSVEVFPSEGSGRISGLTWSDGLVRLPHEAIDIAPGDPVDYLPYSGFDLT
ncbi:MAG: gephyrin-like molybdotransferase Glp [Pseudomonadota bacterium]